jgi:Tfp pilus assembly protein PilO
MDKRYITGIIFLTIAVVIAIVFTDAKYIEMVFISDALQKKEKEFKGQQLLVREVEALNKEFAANIKDLKRVDKYLPLSKNVADLLVQMDYMTSRNGLIMKDVSFYSEEKKRTVDSGEYSVVSVDLKMAGSYNSFVNFSKDVKNSLHLMDIVNFSIKAENNNSEEEGVLDENISQEPVLQFSINLDAYYQ